MKRLLIEVNGIKYDVKLEEIDDNEILEKSAATSSKEVEIIESPMPGNIIKINVNEGDTVDSGDILMILESMKMENEILASKTGRVVSIEINQGDTVNMGDVLLVLE